MNKVKRAWPAARLVALFGFTSSSVLLLVSWVAGDRHFITGLKVGLTDLVLAGVVALLILLLAPLVVDEDRRGPGGRS